MKISRALKCRLRAAAPALPTVRDAAVLAYVLRLTHLPALAGSGLLLFTVALPGRAADGVVVFENNCASCHGLDGKARTPAGKKLGARDLSESTANDEAIARQIRDGVKDGRGVDRMPAFKDRLTADEQAAVRDYVKTFRKK